MGHTSIKAICITINNSIQGYFINKNSLLFDDLLGSILCGVGVRGGVGVRVERVPPNDAESGKDALSIRK